MVFVLPKTDHIGVEPLRFRRLAQLINAAHLSRPHHSHLTGNASTPSSLDISPHLSLLPPASLIGTPYPPLILFMFLSLVFAGRQRPVVLGAKIGTFSFLPVRTFPPRIMVMVVRVASVLGLPESDKRADVVRDRSNPYSLKYDKRKLPPV